jgi:hypothetical protein
MLIIQENDISFIKIDTANPMTIRVFLKSIDKHFNITEQDNNKNYDESIKNTFVNLNGNVINIFDYLTSDKSSLSTRYINIMADLKNKHINQ